MIEKCPKCGETTGGGKWDRWDCRGCGYGISQKARKAYPRIERVRHKKKVT